MRMRNAVAMLWLAAGPAMAADDWVLLEKAAQAAKQQALVGAYFHQIGSTSESFRLYRAVSGGVLRERRESLDGAPRDIVRSGNDVTCYAPDKDSLAAARVSASKLFPVLLPEDVSVLRAAYTLSRQGQDRVAQKDCQWVQLKPRDNAVRYTQRLCLDKTSQLPLKLVKQEGDGDVAETFSFTELDYTPARPKQLRSGYKLNYAMKMAASQPAAEAEDPGFDVKGLPTGFRLMRSMVRTLPGSADRPVRHMVFSDGLVMLSLFIEPTSSERPAGATHGSQGAISMVSSQAGDYQLTLVGEMPEPGLQAVARALRVNRR